MIVDPRGPTRARHRARSAAVAVVALVTLLAGLVATAPEALAQDGVPGVRLVLSDLDAVVGPGSVPASDADQPPSDVSTSLRARVLVENGSDTTLDRLRLVVEVHDRLTTRSGLRAAVEGPGPEGPGRVVVDRAIDPLAPGAVGQELLEVADERGGWAAPGLGITLHPVVVSVLRGTEVLDEVRTAAVWLEGRPLAPVETTALLPVSAVPARLLEGVGLADALRPGAEVDRLVTTAEAASPGTFSLAPDAALLEDLRAAADGGVAGAETLLARLQAVLAAAPTGPVTQPYALADVSSLAASPATAELASLAVTEGRQRIRGLSGRAPAAVDLAPTSVGPGALDLVPVDLLAVRWDDGAGPDLSANPTVDLPPAVRTTRTPSGRTLSVLVGDPWVTRLLADADGEAGWAVDAHRVMAETAMLHAEAPGTGGRTLALLPPPAWGAPGDLGPELATRLLAAPWLRISDPGGVVAASTEPVAGWTAVPATELEPDLRTTLATARQRLGGLASSLLSPLDATDGTATGPPVDLRTTSDELLRATSSLLDVPAATERVAAVRAAVDAALGTVEVPVGAAVTLTSERGTVPVTLQHPDGTGLDVRVTVTGQGRLAFVGGQEQRVALTPGGTSTVSFDATALGRGTFPVLVTVTTADGAVVLDSAILSVRATVVSRPALVAVGVVVLLLLLLGGRRRRRGPQLEVVRDPDTT